jgi:hypothetical protein
MPSNKSGLGIIIRALRLIQVFTGINGNPAILEG